MTTVAIIGAGELGGATAQALAARECVGRILLMDAAGKVAAGKALDILQSGAVDGFHARLEGTDDFTRVTGCAVCVVADPFGGGELHGDEALTLTKRLMPYLGDAPLVFAGALQADVLGRAAAELGVSRSRLIGSAPEALSSAIRAIVAMEAPCSPSEVMLAVLGAPPDGFVVPWSEASIGGHALEQVLTQVQLTRVEARAARLWPPGPYSLGVAAARVVEAIVGSSRRTFHVLTVLGGEFGVRRRAGVLPVRLGAPGIVGTRVPTLNTRERVQLETVLGR